MGRLWVAYGSPMGRLWVTYGSPMGLNTQTAKTTNEQLCPGFDIAWLLQHGQEREEN